MYKTRISKEQSTSMKKTD